ncbi:hypothetical protein HK414_12990 [Ramlibacter terrae]|uniref:Uncharacterized protein n=1 Tax=Ramlibacter terrae TaxID=2732511 RepID=A0ABX6P5U6_9BURK|nr:hypothetical protein HK414_12990 [Ramlibacter terrae]
MMNKMEELAREVTGDSVMLEQGAGFGEVDRVSLHALQVRLLAAEMGLLEGDGNAWRRVDALERRLRVLTDRRRFSTT